MSTAWAFAGDAALVTGAASGIGKATAAALYDAGLQVLILDRDGAAAAAACAELGDRADTARPTSPTRPRPRTR